MIHVVHLITSLDTGGAEVMLSRLVEAMDRERFRSTVISLTADGAIGEKIAAAGIAVEVIGMRRGRPSIGGLFRLWRRLRQLRPDVLQTWLYHSDLLGLLVGRAVGVPAIAWNIRCSVTDARYTRGINGAVVKALARLSGKPDAVISNSHAGRREHERLGYHVRRWENLPNGVQTGDFSPDPEARARMRSSLGLTDDNFTVGLVGRYDPLKDHKTFVEAARLFALERPSAVFVLAGLDVDDSNTVLKDQIAGAGLWQNFRLLGEREDIPDITRAFDVATCSSLGEGFPTVLVEAMACGVPCVSTDVGDAAIIVGDTGHIVPVGDATAISDSWRRISELGPEEFKSLAERCRRRVLDNFSLEAVTSQYEALYYDLAGR